MSNASKIKPFINKFNWQGVIYSSEKKGLMGESLRKINWGLLLRFIDTYVKNNVPKGIILVMKHVNFQLYTVHLDRIIKKKTDKCLQIHKQTCLNFYTSNDVHKRC